MPAASEHCVCDVPVQVLRRLVAVIAQVHTAEPARQCGCGRHVILCGYRYLLSHLRPPRQVGEEGLRAVELTW
ncbi:MAG TPA: hypothetical protein VLJ59_19780 [Mycobacteriales bacterium]|nr:hypothetical protein [Mycobacteriales bacterium]